MGIERILERIVGGGVGTSVATGLAGSLLGGLVGRRRGLGGLALVGGLAWLAYQKFASKREGSIVAAEPSDRATLVGGTPDAPRVAGEIVLDDLEEPPADSGFLPRAEAERAELGLLLVRAMIAAAKADGELDFDESTHIFGKIGELGLDQEERAVLERELRAPLDVDAIANAPSSMEERAEVYTASALVSAALNDAEREYLDELRERMGLDQGLAREIEDAVGAAREA